MGKNSMTIAEPVAVEKTKLNIEEPGFYKVIFINDDVTPMEFVIELLQKIFKHDMEAAQNIMLTVHTEGSAIAGVYSYEIAEQKGVESTVLARNNGFPLQVKVEKQ
jgi:ATP-dependent Clp protease adaptor protein ClpS